MQIGIAKSYALRAMPSVDVPKAVRIPLHFSRHEIPFFLARLGSASGVPVLVDMGSLTTTSVAAADSGRVFPDGWKRSVHHTLEGLHGLEQVALIRLPYFEASGIVERDLLCDINYGAYADNSIGLEFLHKYRAIFDFPADSLILVPRAKSPPNEADMSGIDIAVHRDVFVISHVEDDSPASLANLKPGTFIEAVDGVPAWKLRDPEVRAKLKKGDGETVTLRIREGGARRDVDSCASAEDLNKCPAAAIS